ncbi:DUF433 domain-containing protein [Tolypothrix sp. FACHB-123]|uniref:DUF433 domain-containing protein n=1 Tax=Tolypothrix sp. FACHB-123 TaxID=2692868 RepID=UPI00168A0012|nr:DUF433 domain-containing protein [Tolypothrix sp. FACHB-123]MBD2358937.1 DUF433 domain-containing protein [Tolypothrix sp. FACHB-123]
MYIETFTPTEAAAFVELPPKKIYKEVEHKIFPEYNPPRLNFAALVYLRLIKEINFIPVDYRSFLYQSLVKALEQNLSSIEIVRFVKIEVEPIAKEVLEFIKRFQAWKKNLVSDPNIMSGETVFPNSRLTVRHIGSMLDRGESLEVIHEDYPYLTEEDIKFAQVYVKAYPSVGRPKNN